MNYHRPSLFYPSSLAGDGLACVHNTNLLAGDFMRAKTQAPQYHSLTQVLERHLFNLQRDTGISMALFVCTVREHYESRHLLHSRSIEWSQVADLSIRMTRDAEKFSRWMGFGVTKQLPIDLLDSVVAAFPLDRRQRLQVELAGRQGLIAVAMPSAHAADDFVAMGSVVKETGEALIAIGGLFDDMVIDSKDRDKAPQALIEIDEAIAALCAMKAVISTKALGIPLSAVFGGNYE